MTVDTKEIFGIQSCCCNSKDSNSTSVQVVTLAKDTNFMKRQHCNSTQFELLSSATRYFKTRSKWCTDIKCLSHCGNLATFLRQWYRMRDNVCAQCGSLFYAEDATFSVDKHIIAVESCRVCSMKARTTWEVSSAMSKKNDSAIALALKTQGIDALCPSPTICKKTLATPLHLCTCSSSPCLVVNSEAAAGLRIFRNIKET